MGIWHAGPQKSRLHDYTGSSQRTAGSRPTLQRAAVVHTLLKIDVCMQAEAGLAKQMTEC